MYHSYNLIKKKLAKIIGCLVVVCVFILVIDLNLVVKKITEIKGEN